MALCKWFHVQVALYVSASVWEWLCVKVALYVGSLVCEWLDVLCVYMCDCIKNLGNMLEDNVSVKPYTAQMLWKYNDHYCFQDRRD